MDNYPKLKPKLLNNILHSSNFNSSLDKLSVLPSTPTTTLHAKGDSGASQHYFFLQAAPHLTNVHPDPNGPSVMLPDRSVIKATHKGHLPYPTTLSPQATSTALFPNLHNNLISIGQLCDDNCQVLLTNRTMKVIKNNKEIINGARSTTGDGLWNIPLPSPPPSVDIDSERLWSWFGINIGLARLTPLPRGAKIPLPFPCASL